MLGPRWTQKPPPGVAIDPSHPLAAGLALFFALNEGTGVPGEALTRAQATSSTATWAASSFGHALYFNGTSQYGLITLPLPSYTGPLSVAAVARPTVGASYQFALSGRGVGFGFNATGVNEINYETYTNSDTYSSPVNAVDYASHTFGATHASNGTNGLLFYRDGQPWGTASPAAFPIAASQNVYLGSQNATGGYFKGPIAALAVWNRALSAAEHAGFAANPWAVFRPHRPAQWTYRGAPPTVVLAGTPVVTSILIQFDEPILAAGLSVSVVVSATGDVVTGTTTYDLGTNIATFTPSPATPFVPGTKYLVSVSGATAIDGTPMAVTPPLPFDPGTGLGTRWFRGLGRPAGRLRA